MYYWKEKKKKKITMLFEAKYKEKIILLKLQKSHWSDALNHSWSLNQMLKL